MEESRGCPGCAQRDALIAALGARVKELEARLAATGGTPAHVSPPGPRPPSQAPVVEPPQAAATTPNTRVSAKGDTVRLPSRAREAAAAREAPAPKLDAETTQKLQRLGFAPEDFDEAARALREHASGLGLISPHAVGPIHGAHIYWAAFAAERFGVESTQRAIRLTVSHSLDGSDLFQAAEADRTAGSEAALMACDLGFRKRDILFAAKSLKEYSNLQAGRKAMEEMQKLLADWRVDVHDEDIRYCALTFKNLGKELLEKALRERHPKNPRENWLRGASIPLVAWAYRLDAAHTGGLIDEANKATTRRERIGHYVISAFERKRSRSLKLPDWL